MMMLSKLIFIPLFLTLGILGIGGLVFSVWMFIDCLKREHNGFKNTFTKDGEYDKIIWAIIIFAGMSFFFLGAILYYFLVKKSTKTVLRAICLKCKNEMKEEWQACPYCGESRK